MNANRTYIILLSIITVIIVAGATVFGSETIFRLWNIPTQKPGFTDLRILPGAAESFRHGFDPAREDPFDPFHRIFNYPRAWYLFFYTGIQQSDIVYMAAILLLLFFAALLFFPGEIQPSDIPILIPAIFSPAVLLAVERGNVDLFIFFLCALSLVCVDFSDTAAFIVLIIASFFKLFPLLGVSIFLDKKQSAFLKIFMAMSAIMLIYAVLTYPNMLASFSYSEKGSDLSYGLNVVPLHLKNLNNETWIFPVFSMISYVAMVVLFILAIIAGIRQDTKPGAAQLRHINAFRMGASIYIGTFFLGNNWDYRLVFLLFTLPQLADWVRSSTTRWRLFARWTLSVIFLSLWYLVLVQAWEFIHPSIGREAAFALDELANWTLFGQLTLLTMASAPDWLQAEFRAAFSKQFMANRHTGG